MSVLDKFLDAIRLNDDFDDDDEFFDDEDLEALDEEKPKHRFFKKLDDDDDEDEEEEVHIDTSEIAMDDEDLDETLDKSGLDLPTGDDAFDN